MAPIELPPDTRPKPRAAAAAKPKRGKYLPASDHIPAWKAGVVRARGDR